ncbi:MAG: hypothetical protein IRY85_15230 [Micromonosporaceae bacterium]|nr:hypothetical protein [Micromonosporaceae bacterium]
MATGSIAVIRWLLRGASAQSASSGPSRAVIETAAAGTSPTPNSVH